MLYLLCYKIQKNILKVGCVFFIFFADNNLLKSQLVVDPGVNKTVCANEKVVLGGQPSASGGSGDYLYSWSPATGLSNQAIANPVLSPDESREYFLTVVDLSNPDTITQSVAITVLDVSEVNAGFDKSVCLHGDLVNVSVFGRIEGPVTTGAWSSSGDGIFPLGNEILSTSYTLGENDKTKDSIYLKLTTTNNGQCPAVSDSFTLFIYPRSQVFAGNDMVFCQDSIIIGLKGSVTGGSSTGIWNTNGKGSFEPSAEDLNISYIPHPDDRDTGRLEFILTSTGLFGCAGASDTLYVTLKKPPEVNAGKDTVVTGRSVGLNGSVKGADKFYWETWGNGNFFPDDSSMVTRYYFSNDEVLAGAEVQIILYAMGTGCKLTADTIVVSTYFNDIPNTFTPNGDGINDVFMKGEHIEIYNRWGQMIYNGYDGWDGKYKGVVVGTGTYFYVIKKSGHKNAPVSFKGSVTIRN